MVVCPDHSLPCPFASRNFTNIKHLSTKTRTNTECTEALTSYHAERHPNSRHWQNRVTQKEWKQSIKLTAESATDYNNKVLPCISSLVSGHSAPPSHYHRQPLAVKPLWALGINRVSVLVHTKHDRQDLVMSQGIVVFLYSFVKS